MYRPTNPSPQRSTSNRLNIRLSALVFFLLSYLVASAYTAQPYEECIREATTARQHTECAIIYLGR